MHPTMFYRFANDEIFEVIYTRTEPIDENQRELIDYHPGE